MSSFEKDSPPFNSIQICYPFLNGVDIRVIVQMDRIFDIGEVHCKYRNICRGRNRSNNWCTVLLYIINSFILCIFDLIDFLLFFVRSFLRYLRNILVLNLLPYIFIATVLFVYSNNRVTLGKGIVWKQISKILTSKRIPVVPLFAYTPYLRLYSFRSVYGRRKQWI